MTTETIFKFLEQQFLAGALALLQLAFPFFFPAPAALAPQTGVGTAVPVYSDTSTLLTYNVKHCQGGTKIAGVAAEIAATGAQIVFLQEIDCGTGRAGGRDIAALLAAELDFSYAYFPTMEYDGGLYGTAILSAFPLTGAAITPLPPTKMIEPRVLGQVDIAIGGTPVRLFVTHLSYESLLARVAQFAVIRGALRAAPGGRFLLGGDFNVMTYAEYDQLPAVPAHGAKTAPEGISRIDNVFCGRGMALQGARWVPTGYSDHDLVLAELALPLA